MGPIKNEGVFSLDGTTIVEDLEREGGRGLKTVFRV